MTELPNIGVLGTGASLKVIVPLLRSYGFHIEALWGSTKKEAEELGEQLSIPFRTCNEDEVILHQLVDLVILHCPPYQQSYMAVKVMNIGKHIICSHPAALNQADTIKMVKSVQYYPMLMGVISNGFRFLPCFSKAREFILSNDYIGEVTLCEATIHCGGFLKDKYDWTCDEIMGGGMLNLYGGLIIDLITFLTGQQARKVHGVLKTFSQQTSKVNGIRHITSDDFCTFQMELFNGACASATINSHLPKQFSFELLVCGSKGYLCIKNSHVFGYVYAEEREDVIMIGPQENPEVEQNFAGMDTSLPPPILTGLGNFFSAIRDAFAAVPNRRELDKSLLAKAETFENAQYVQAVIDALRKSAKSQEWTKVKILEDEPPLESFVSDTAKRTALSIHY